MTAQNSAVCPRCNGVVAGRRCDQCGIALAAGEYRVERLLAESNQARTYLARDASGEAVFLKELLFLSAPDPAAVAAFAREGELLKQLRHPGIPQYLSHFSEGDGRHLRLYLAVRYLEGVSLLAELGAHRYSEDEVRLIASEVLEVLRYLHGRTPAIIHRDIKPANILRGTDGRLAVVDFGSARDAALQQANGATMTGTIGYAPPEQLGGKLSPSSDVYALAATLIHLLTRKAPWEDFEAGIKFNPGALGVSRPLTAWLARALEPRPSRRFASADQAARALEAKAWRPSLPSKVLLALAAVGAVAIIGVSQVPTVRPVGVEEFCAWGDLLGGEPQQEQYCQTEVRGKPVRNGVSVLWQRLRGAPQIVAITHYKKGVLEGEYAAFGPEGEKVESGRFVDGKRQGPWRTVEGEGALVDGKKQGPWTITTGSGSNRSQEQVAFVDDSRNGLSTTSFGDGRKSTATFQSGRLHGEATEYFPDGKIKSMTTWVGGEMHGPSVEFASHGPKVTSGSHAAGLREGLWTDYTYEGLVRSTKEYRAGTLVATADFWGDRSNLKREEERYDLEAKTSTITSFNETGVKLSVRGPCDADSAPSSATTCHLDFFPGGAVKRRCLLREGAGSKSTARLDGLCRELNEDGSLKSEGELLEGAKTGTWKYFWPSSELMRVEEHSDARLSGEQRDYFQSGRLRRLGKWLAGKRTGVWTEWAADGEVIYKHDYGSPRPSVP